MALNIPPKSPGDQLTSDEYNAHVEASTLSELKLSGVGKITVSTTPPVAPAINDLWIDIN